MSEQKLHDLLEQIAAYRRVEESLADELKNTKNARRAFERQAAEHFMSEGITSTKLPSGLRGEVRHFLSVTKRGNVDQEVLCLALEGAGWGHCIVTMAQSAKLKASVKEVLDRDYPPGADPKDALPASIRDMLNIFEEARVVVTGAGLAERNERTE